MGCIFFATSCLKPETFPPEPAIEFQSFQAMGDSGLVTISFTDGDGDIGLNENDTLAPYAPNTYFYYNMYLEYFEMMDGQWVRGTTDPNGENFPTADSITFAFRLEDITPIGQNKALKGDIQITLEPFYFNINSNHSDSIKYEIVLIDRSLNVSNRIETPLIVTQ